jgi:hypothetical protein
MGMCSLHGMPNNRYGYCPGCEADPRIQILRCRKCGNPFAVSVTQSADLCQRCAIDDIRGFTPGRR